MPAKLVGRLTAKFMDLLTAKLVDRLATKPMVVNLFKLHLTKLKISHKIDVIFKIHHQGLIRPLYYTTL